MAEELAPTLADQLEELIDKHGIREVIVMARRICYGKADHLLTNWQDRPAADFWQQVGDGIDEALAERWWSQAQGKGGENADV